MYKIITLLRLQKINYVTVTMIKKHFRERTKETNAQLSVSLFKCKKVEIYLTKKNNKKNFRRQLLAPKNDEKKYKKRNKTKKIYRERMKKRQRKLKKQFLSIVRVESLIVKKNFKMPNDKHSSLYR